MAFASLLLSGILPEAAEPGLSTPISDLHSLQDAENFALSDRTTIYTVIGTVYTHHNLTAAPNFLFYIQDESGGIPVFWRNNTFEPKPGDLVRVTAALDQFNGLTELIPNGTNASTEVALLSANSPLPEPTGYDLSWTAAEFEQVEGSYVVVSNVLLDTTAPTFSRNGENVSFTDPVSGRRGILRIDSRAPMAGQLKPTTLVTIFGALGQFDSSRPYSSGYQVVATRPQDLVTEVDQPPYASFTNIFSNLTRGGQPGTNSSSEMVLLPGETVTITLQATHPANKVFTLSVSQEAWPQGGAWEIPESTGTNLSATFRYTAPATVGGTNLTVALQAATPTATNRSLWTIYLPTESERGLVITEFLANPVSSATSPHYNPLQRSEPPVSTSQNEYIELVNFSPQPLDLAGWTVSDAVTVRHKFHEPFTLASSNAVVLYGGPFEAALPQLPGVITIPVSTGSQVGFGLNNSGGDTITIRNAQGYLVTQIAYTTLPAAGSMTRALNASSGFVPHSKVSTNFFSPGFQPNGEPFTISMPTPGGVGPLRAFWAAGGVLTLSWTAEAGRKYDVLATDDLATPFTVVADDVTFTGTAAAHAEETLGARMRFYRISAE